MSNQILTQIKIQARKWNVKYPLDKWYRDKFNIQFNSKQHTDTEITDIRLMFEEEVLYKKSLAELLNKPTTPYQPGTGKWIKQSTDHQLNNEQINDLYDKLNIKDLDEDADEIII